MYASFTCVTQVCTRELREETERDASLHLGDKTKHSLVQIEAVEDFLCSLQNFVDVVHLRRIALQRQVDQRHLQGHDVFGRHVGSVL